MYIESISGLVAIHSVHKQFVPAHLANEQVTSVKQILFLWGHDPYTLACEASQAFIRRMWDSSECVIVIVNGASESLSSCVA